MRPLVLQRIVEIWGSPDLKNSGGHVMNSKVTPAAAWAVLHREFGVEAVRAEIRQFLLTQGEREVEERRAEQDDFFLINSCFKLCKSMPELALDAATTKRLILTLPPVGFHREMAFWAKRHFDQAGLLLVLAEGIHASRTDMMRACAVHGLAMYLYEVPESPSASLCPALLTFEAALRTAVPSSHVLVRESVDQALKAIWKLRERHPCPKLDPRDTTAFRCEEGDKVFYTVERRNDGYMVLDLPKLETVEQTLVVEYQNQEPSLLPAEVPKLLSATLFQAHLSEHAARSVDTVRFVDLRLRRVVELPADQALHEHG